MMQTTDEKAAAASCRTNVTPPRGARKYEIVQSFVRLLTKIFKTRSTPKLYPPPNMINIFPNAWPYHSLQISKGVIFQPQLLCDLP